MLGLLSLYFDKPLILINRQLDKQTKQIVCGYALGHYLEHQLLMDLHTLDKFLTIKDKHILLYEHNAFTSHLMLDSDEVYSLTPQLTSPHNNKPVYRLQRQSIRRLVLVPPYFVFCSISFRCGGLSIERNQKPLTPENTLAITHHDKQKQVEVKRSSRANPHEFRLFSGCPYAVVK